MVDWKEYTRLEERRAAAEQAKRDLSDFLERVASERLSTTVTRDGKGFV